MDTLQCFILKFLLVKIDTFSLEILLVNLSLVINDHSLLDNLVLDSNLVNLVCILINLV